MIRKMLPAVVAIGGLLGTAAGAHAAATTGREYVVVYEQGASDAAARAAIEAAGGRVVSENTDIGVATVRTSDSGFAAEVAGSAAIAGATTNRVIGKAPQDAVKRDAVEHDVGSIRGGAPFGGAPGGDPLPGCSGTCSMIHATPAGLLRVASRARRRSASASSTPESTEPSGHRAELRRAA